MQKGQYTEILAIASRDEDRAREQASRLGISRAYGSYEALLNDPEIDAVYNPLPNHLHTEWSIKALRAGKHVLCEKPLGLSAVDAKQLLKESRSHPHLKVMEAFMYRLHPQWKKAKSLADAGKIGKLKAIQSFFSYHNVDPKNIRNQLSTGGGGLMDIGCYCVSLSRFLFNEEPQMAVSTIERDPGTMTDIYTSGILQFAEGTATFTCSTQLFPYQRVNILGTGGRIEIEIPFNAPPDQPTRITVFTSQETEEIILPAEDQYTIQGDEFSKAVLDDTAVPTPLEDAISNMKVLDALFESAIKGEWMRL
jgi:predicted dehydrogenase